MKVSAQFCLALAGICVLALAAQATTARLGVRRATVISIAKEPPVEGFRAGDNPSDASMRSESYDYDVTLRIGCGTYVGRYESAYDYLPSTISANNKIKVTLEKRFVDVNSGSQQIRMPIVHRSRRAGCVSKP